MKSEVYSWRVSPETKVALEAAARKEQISLAALLDRMAKDWLRQSSSNTYEDAAEQARLHVEAARSIGAIEGKDRNRAARVRSIVRNRLKSKHGR